ncbi:CusA/CzcA family heavy metal efflux RND transporter [Babesia caballi]|uniref:CusA/CzcA family heavy metal efflux RND transporter n=1 Tax=Babesia caballi TaxID=5871 RepID=A0AAV4LLT2_BABCB|nr:CusA/CzcA family heavy metal efflux RND transporter [Babesia caballi]
MYTTFIKAFSHVSPFFGRKLQAPPNLLWLVGEPRKQKEVTQQLRELLDVRVTVLRFVRVLQLLYQPGILVQDDVDVMRAHVQPLGTLQLLDQPELVSVVPLNLALRLVASLRPDELAAGLLGRLRKSVGEVDGAHVRHFPNRHVLESQLVPKLHIGHD